MSFARHSGRRSGGALVAALLLCLLHPAPGRADDLADFHAAVERAAGQYRVALQVLETRGREETAAAVHRFRAAWQDVIDRFEKNPPAALRGDEQYAGTFMQIDMRIVGALLVIDMGSREAARDALAPIADTLARLGGSAQGHPGESGKP